MTNRVEQRLPRECTSSYSASFSCNFYLFSYPFDTQVCSLLIELDSADTSVVNFINDSVVYTGLLKLPKYDITEIISKAWEKSTTPFEILAGYRLTSRSFIRLADFDVRTVMTLTTLLVLYTLFNQVSTNLPDTAYIKMIDMWFFFCIFLIFAVNILHVLVEHLPSTDNNVINISPNSKSGRLSRLRKVTGPWTMRMALIGVPVPPQEGHRPLDYEDGESPGLPGRCVRLQRGVLDDHSGYGLGFGSESEHVLEAPTGPLTHSR
ncbi:uncharacterized protein LOC122243372 [Penaeus japonicus]|uniref:uncharacterized protein LOC122243372 n=1 Tax=Penaeus japonicus TaxID=27405 RepID=UPI001C717626|nr:uncharacterized protein LOC122243372 [Penaeus japonicus]